MSKICIFKPAKFIVLLCCYLLFNFLPLHQNSNSMETVAGIKYTKSPKGNKRYVRVDLDMYGENQLLEDFLDMIDIEASKNESDEYIPLEEFMKTEYERRGLKYEAI